MRSKKVTRYYCDHCNKGRLAKHSMVRHEATCVHNPKRQCGLCENAANGEPMEKLIEALWSGGVSAVRNLVDGCPTCVLAVLVQARKVDDEKTWIEFDYKAELSEYYREMNPALHAVSEESYF